MYMYYHAEELFVSGNTLTVIVAHLFVTDDGGAAHYYYNVDGQCKQSSAIPATYLAMGPTSGDGVPAGLQSHVDTAQATEQNPEYSNMDDFSSQETANPTYENSQFS